MFGRRKSKKQDEPLVPHGLIWQATDEPEEPAGLLKPTGVAQVMEMSPPENSPSAAVPDRAVPVAQPREVAQADASATRMGAISPPIPWPSPKTASVIRRTPPPAVPVITSSPIAANIPELEKRGPQVVAHRVPPAEPKSAVIESPATVALVRKQWKPRANLTELGGSLQRKAKGAYSGAARTLILFRGKARLAYAAINPGAKVAGALQLIKKNTGVVIAGCRAGGARLRSGWVSAAPHVARLKAEGATAASKAFRTSISRGGDLVQRARNHRIRIRIEAPVSARAFIERSKRAWANGRQSMRRESRLWTSIAMGALSALLAIGVISAVSRNAPGAHASNKSVGNSRDSSAINPIIVVAPRRISDAGRTTARASHSNTSSDFARANPPKTQENTPQESKALRPHHIADDDYVAPNTYHYYGQQGKQSKK